LIEPTTLEKSVWHLATHPEFAFTTGLTVGFGSMQYLWRNGFHNGKGFLEENLVTATCLVRKSIHRAIGEYDELNRAGLEDWDFWLKAAAHGHWGSTIPEFFDWYRRRDTGREHWDNLGQEKTNQFRAQLCQRYPALWQRAFPQVAVTRPQFGSSFSNPLPFLNKLTKERPRLLFLVPHFELGGADKFNLDLIRQLQRQHGYEITVVATRRSPNPWLHEFESLTPDVFILPNFLQPFDFPLFLRYLITSRQPDVACISNSMLGYQLLPCLRTAFPKLPFVDYLHMEQEEWMAGGYPRYSLHQRHQLARTAVSSQHLKSWMSKRGADGQRIDVCSTNIDSELWRRERFNPKDIARKWNLDLTAPLVLYAGRICEQKQPRIFAQVVKRVVRQDPSVTFLVAGDGPDLPWLMEFSKKEALPQLRFLGAVANEEIAELLAVADIFFLPSQWEGISLALFEAMAMGVVPVSAVVGGQAELVTPDTGILVQRGANEVPDYTNALLRLLRSPEQRRRLATAARDRVVRLFPIRDLGRRLHESFIAAQAEMSGRSEEFVFPSQLAELHAAEIIEQTRATDCADMLHRQHEELLSHTRHSINWRSGWRAGCLLAEYKQTQAAVQILVQSVKEATASGRKEIEFLARVEVAKVLVSLEPHVAREVLSPAAGLAVSLGKRDAALEIEGILNQIPAIVNQGKLKTPRVSVVIPCYKQAQFLPEAVESVVAQTFCDWELIIVNDGSPDNTSAVAGQLIAKYPGKTIHLIEQPNGGLSFARNAGIRAAKGQYILPLDADDRVDSTILQKLVPVLDRQPAVGFAYTHIKHFGAIHTEFPLPDFDRQTLVEKDNIICVCALFRKSVWEQVGGYNESMREGYEDWDFWIGCVAAGWEGYCLHEPLFYYRKSGQSMLSEANQKRPGLIARIVLNHPKLYSERTIQWAKNLLSDQAGPKVLEASLKTSRQPLRITYLISSILGVTGGNQTLLRQAEEMRKRGHDVTIVTFTPKPDWFHFQTRVIQVQRGKAMAAAVPPSDVVVATYFLNVAELALIKAPVKVYYAQGDQFVFGDQTMADTAQNRQLRELSRASYLLPGIKFVPNSLNLARAVEKLCGRCADAILPVCTDQTIFRPLARQQVSSGFRLLVVGPDTRGSDVEPLLFKGMQDIRDALELLRTRGHQFTTVRMSGTPPQIFNRFPCEFHIAPKDETKTVLFGTSHIHIYASHYDSCPRPPQEAMAAGCVVVCTATSGALEYCVDGENCLTVPIKSPAAIADAVERIMRDTALREKVIAGGFATARQFPREREWNEWEAIMYQFLDEASANQRKPIPTNDRVVSSPRTGAQTKVTLPACALVGELRQAQESLLGCQLREAWDFTTSAIYARPYHPEAYALLAQIAETAGDKDSARQCAKRARQLAPSLTGKPVRRHPRPPTVTTGLVLPTALVNDQPCTQALTVCVITKDEESNLERCLNSVKEVATQIVVLDTGSTDRTAQIAQSLGAEVHHFDWCDDFSAARNAALEHARGGWVLILDADEELPPDQHARLRADLKDAKNIALRLPLINHGQETEGRSCVPRLFRNVPGAHYTGRIHEQVFPSLIALGKTWGLGLGLGTARILHHGYTKEAVEGRNKVERNLALLRQAIEESPDDPNLAMNFGLELVRSGDLHGGLPYYRRAFNLMTVQGLDGIAPELREVLLTQFTSHLYKAGEHQEVVQILTSPLASKPGLTASMHFALGLAQFAQARYADAAEQLRQCIAKRDQAALTPINVDILTAAPYHCLALSLAKSGDTDGAEKAFKRGWQETGRKEELILDYARFLEKQNRSVDALHRLHEAITANPLWASAWCLGAQIAVSRPDSLDFACDWTAEALKHLPDSAEVTALRAEALLLNQQTSRASQLWKSLCNQQPQPPASAAFILCELIEDSPLTFSEPQECDLGPISRALINWYQRCLAMRAQTIVQRVNERLHVLRSILPSAADMIEAALVEAGEPSLQVAEPCLA
jgi:glycosyltransferase involved in cell wall biosynthesis/Tfp pilus assembly protein PilF